MTDKSITREQLTEAANDWLKCQFIVRRDPVKRIFNEISTYDYETLFILAREMGLHKENVYLKDISTEMDIPMSKISPRASRLQEKGLVYWEHDENGSYIRISERGMEAMNRQQERLVSILSKTVEEFGYERFIEQTKTRQELNKVLDMVLDSEE